MDGFVLVFVKKEDELSRILDLLKVSPLAAVGYSSSEQVRKAFIENVLPFRAIIIGSDVEVDEGSILFLCKIRKFLSWNIPVVVLLSEDVSKEEVQVFRKMPTTALIDRPYNLTDLLGTLAAMTDEELNVNYDLRIEVTALNEFGLHEPLQLIN